MNHPATISEDDRYRGSTQFRLWSYTPSSLLALRTQTNHVAAQRVQAAVERVRAIRALSSADTSEAETGRSTSVVPEGEVECLTPEEELRLLWYYCGRTLAMGDHLNLPTDVKATAVQYLKRFYLTNSIMTYAPADILKTALFFSTKTENHYVRLSKFADSIGKTQPEDVLASEFLLTQGLRFTFDVRHPFRALEGACMEINALSEGDIPTLPNNLIPWSQRPESLGKRIKIVHGSAREILKTNALLTDVYFHYTPSQIMMAAMYVADAEILEWYLSTKFMPGDASSQGMRMKVLGVVKGCAEMMVAIQPQPDMELTAAEKKEIKALSKKLSKCRNPEKIDLVGLQKAKREGSVEDDRAVKKRKFEREAGEKEGNDLFGPEIKR